VSTTPNSLLLPARCPASVVLLLLLLSLLLSSVLLANFGWQKKKPPNPLTGFWDFVLATSYSVYPQMERWLKAEIAGSASLSKTIPVLHWLK